MNAPAVPETRGEAPPPVVVEALSVRFGANEVLRGIDLVVEPGRMLGILGPNGCGKTTLLRCIAGLLAPTGGRVAIMGDDVRSLKPAELSRRLALQAQDSPGALGYTVRDVVGMGRLAHRTGRWGTATPLDDEVVSRCLADLDLGDFADRPIETLSGGERQRAMIARALAQEPRILLLDEPTNHLDIGHRFAVMERVRSLGITVIVTLHDIEFAGRICDRLLLLHEGRVAVEGVPNAALTREMIGRVYGVGASIDRQPETGQIRIDLQPLGRGGAS